MNRIHDGGVTLVELLASLVIGSVILSVVVYTGSYEYKSWIQVTSQSNLQSDVTYVDGKLQDVFQNLTGVKVDTQYATQMVQVNGSNVLSGVAVQGTDAQGQTVEVVVQPNTNPSSGTGQPISQIVVTYTPSGATVPAKTTVLPSPFTSFAGTNFVVNGPLVVANLSATFTGQSSNPLVNDSRITYVTEGGY